MTDSTGGRAPRLYIVTACRNAERTIATCLESVVSQLEHVARHMVIDGVSTDSTLRIVEGFRADYGDKLLLVSEPDTGIYDAMNKGVRACLAEADDDDLIATLNADDRYEPNIFSLVAGQAARHPEVDVLYGDMILLDDSGSDTGRRWHSVNVFDRDACADGMPIEHPTMFVRARTYRRIGMYDTSYRIAADYEFALRLAETPASSRHLGAVVVGFRHGGVSTTHETASLKESIRARVAHGSSPVAEWTRYYRRRITGALFSAVRWVPGLADAQRRYGASARAKCEREEPRE